MPVRLSPPYISSIAALALIAVACVLSVPSLDRAADPLTAVLVGLAALALWADTRYDQRLHVSGSFVVLMLGAAALGPAGAVIVAAGSELIIWPLQRFRYEALLTNIAAAAFPIAIAGLVFDAVLADTSGAVFALTVTAVSFIPLGLSFLISSPSGALVYGTPMREAFRVPGAMVPTLLLTIAFTVIVLAVYEEIGLAATALALLLMVAFTYAMHLVTTARERTRQYASLSWGVLSGLVRTLDQRDPHAARHSAAVAAFSRDIAKHVGMSTRDQELAHTAGLLHDIGRFAFADRVLEPGHELTDDDWQLVQRHPEIGADLLPDLEVYGPVAEIVRAHHERVDGRGYPDGLGGEDIPEIARIVAVAEAYDTLTAADTYREQKTSFEALTELRRVVGSQLDGRYVEALAELLAGRGTDYRHADAADFDRELAIQRKIADAVGQN
ncbi:HD domain-containing protein [Svornostia abyssi]|uniref:HD domain-containing protein n=1 Tax=Svornostia abyssi TaxID=2898438 RepID=A0ABY5PJ34_9ACTN|nr:HD domain-containing protein [Parviterribacteraceae bacterium J379]